ncbi:MAG: cation diffusion facilitator family transporter [Archaeoglobaceae archaeon]|nr:cation diffusion facilitator family transporter [Archaeoglobaceae archaeon]
MTLYKVLAIYLITLFIKLIAFYFSNLTMILADALHSIVDITIVLVLIIASHLSAKIADEIHPHGYGLIKNIASFAASIAFLTLISFELIKEGVRKIISPDVYENLEIALIFETMVLFLLISTTLFLRKQKGVLKRTAMLETLNDSLSTFTVISGIIFIAFGYFIFDGIITILIALIIAYNSLKLLGENIRFLLGLSPSEEFYSRVEKSIKGMDGVKSVHNMFAIYTSENEIHLDLHITIDGKMKVEEADELSHKIADKLKAEFQEVKHVSIHFCPHSGKRRKIYNS